MRLRLTSLLLAAAILLAIPAAASASSSHTTPDAIPLNRALYVQQGSALAEVYSLSSVPVGFTASAGQAMIAAEHSRVMQALHRRMHPLHVYPYVWRSTHPHWYVIFTNHDHKIVGAVSLTKTGKVTGAWTGRQAGVTYAQGGWSWSITSWLIIAPASLLFMLAFFDPRRLRSIAHLDALAVLAFLASYLLLADQHLDSAVWLAYPPLIYLLVRMLMVGFGRGFSRARLAPLLSTRTLLIGLPLLLAARIWLSFAGHQEIDVGYESVIGAFRILHHLPIYYNDPNHGDTYGPITYLAYVPFELLWPWKDSLSDLLAANFAAIFFDFGTMLGLFLLGRRLRRNEDGTRFGLVLVWAWAACPFTIVSLVVHTNDGLVAMLTVFALLVFTSPVASGALLGLATAAKFSPAGMLPLLAAPRQRGVKGAAVCVGSFAAVVGLAIYSWLPPQGFSYFWQRTIGFQLSRPDVFSPWALHPSLHPLQTAVEVLAVIIVAAVAFVPRERSLATVCALAGAVTIAVQLPATHWYYYYIIWFLPFVLVASMPRPVLAAEVADEAAVVDDDVLRGRQGEPALAGA